MDVKDHGERAAPRCGAEGPEADQSGGADRHRPELGVHREVVEQVPLGFQKCLPAVDRAELMQVWRVRRGVDQPADQGTHAARNLLAGREGAKPFSGSNYFWSDQYGVRIQFAGVPDAEETEIVTGSVDDRRFTAYYRRGGRLVGVLALNSPRHFVQARRLIEQGSDWDSARTAALAVA
ncbi:oxidoreductase C-terminal domain-containing protein [Streptomyces sp. NPDC056938]|uniref:oxidoreductase C-terminal domain-containing protein n=1 Tax=unclassified Streptomyces TaxID=2593676 RepID=UPI00363C9E8A